MFFYSRVLPASGAIPTPGNDMPGASWLQHMRLGEIAVFSLDAESRQVLKPKGEVARLPVEEVCMIFGSRYTARFYARNAIISRPQTMVVLYDRRGRWLSTRTREGETRRNPGLGLAWILLQFPLLAVYGTLAILALSALGTYYFGTEPMHVTEMASQQLSSLFAAGLMVGAFGRLLFELVRMRLVIWHGKPARSPMGSQEREKMYRRMARTRSSGLLVPLDVTLVPAQVEWPLPEKYREWAASLEKHGFQHSGQFDTPETKGAVDFWFNSEKELTAIIATLFTKGMWLTVFTRYEDGSSFSACNKDSTGLDSHPQRKGTYLGPDASAEAVIEYALSNRPGGAIRRPTPENLLEDYKKFWRISVEWRRARGTTAEEIKRVDEHRGKAKAAGEGKT
ncbi:MAG TPA: hypothetical protein VE377_04805 [Candidatus Dormibacteraeota bacterium]|nr:hypothetical protein [Candidatus Dormibacteraeota bacterium]